MTESWHLRSVLIVHNSRSTFFAKAHLPSQEENAGLKKVGCQYSCSLAQTQRGVESHEVVLVPAKTTANNTSRKGEKKKKNKKKKKRTRGIQGQEEREKVIISRVLY